MPSTTRPWPLAPFARTVIASTYLNDNYRSDFPEAEFDVLALVLLLNPEAPYYTVTQITQDGDGPWLMVGEMADDYTESGDTVNGYARWNIVPAVQCYSDSGGDF